MAKNNRSRGPRFPGASSQDDSDNHSMNDAINKVANHLSDSKDSPKQRKIVEDLTQLLIKQSQIAQQNSHGGNITNLTQSKTRQTEERERHRNTEKDDVATRESLPELEKILAEINTQRDPPIARREKPITQFHLEEDFEEQHDDDFDGGDKVNQNRMKQRRRTSNTAALEEILKKSSTLFDATSTITANGKRVNQNADRFKFNFKDKLRLRIFPSLLNKNGRPIVNESPLITAAAITNQNEEVESEEEEQQEQEAPDIFERMRLIELRAINNLPPTNHFERLKQWTRDGVLWPLPINNELGLDGGEEDPETPYSFADHMMLQANWLGDRLPRTGPIGQFMNLVCVGLAHNPHLGVPEKRAHIDWLVEYLRPLIDERTGLPSKTQNLLPPPPPGRLAFHIRRKAWRKEHKARLAVAATAI